MSDRKSWREKDRAKDRSSHRRDERPRGPSPRVDSATAQYKRSLDAFFDKGVVPDSLKGKLPDGHSMGPSERQTLLREIRESKGGKALEKAIDTFLKEYDLPEDPEVWLRVLEHTKDSVLLRIVTRVGEYVESGQLLPRKALFIERLKGLEFTSFDPRVQSRSIALVARLRGLPEQ